MSDVNFEHYKIFYYVTRFQNITSAAHALYLSQPSVSRCIANLEEELGCRLFIRSKKGVELTSEGQQLYRHVRIACKHLFSAEEELSLMKNEAKGVLRLAISDAAFQQRIISRISRFHEQYPSVHLKIDNMPTPETIEAVHTNVVDMAVVTAPFSSPYDLNTVELCDLQDIAVAGQDFSYLKDKTLSFEELNSYSLITLEEGSTTRHYIDKLFRQHGILMNPDIELASISQVLPLVRSNLGIGFVPLRLAEDDIRSGKVFRIQLKEDIPPRSICLITDDEYDTNDIMIAFTQMLTNPDINPPLNVPTEQAQVQ
jgi:DNA-binding transcriptional LysR family regulator